MARHRNFRNIDIDDELNDEDDDYRHPFGTSLDDEIPPSPGTAQFLYRRPNFGGDIVQSCNTNQQLGKCGSDETYYDKSDYGKSDWPETQFFLEETEDEFERKESFEKIVAKPTAAKSKKIAAKENTAKNESILTNFEPATNKSHCVNASLSARNIRTFHPVLPEIENLRISAAEKNEGQKFSSSTVSLKPNQSSRRLSALAAAQASPTASPKLRCRAKDAKPLINFVIVGHVDAGKSTLIGHLMYMMGYVDSKTMHKYKQEAGKTGKASFAFAWVLDETQEERERGVTMDIARTTFDTPHRRIVILDAPGHKDFIHNMIAGAGQADAGLLVANATRGEFETGFDQGGQTREHAMVLRSLGVSEIMVAVNKMDTVDWSKQRYDEVCAVLKTFLCKQAGFSKVHFIPVSGLCGINLTEPPPTSHPLASWYSGPTLIQMIDEVKEPIRAENRPLRAVISDVFKCTSSTVSVTVKIEAGFVEAGEKLYIMPNADPVVVKSLMRDSENNDDNTVAFSGEHSSLTLTALNSFEPDSICVGQVICRGGSECLVPGKRFIARLVVFNIIIPIMKGTRADLFVHSLCEACTVVRLEAIINKTSGQITKKKPRCLPRNVCGIVEIETDRAICIEPFSQCRPLGRVTLRSAGQTIAAGIIEKVILPQ